jgi:hypothetical protein
MSTLDTSHARMNGFAIGWALFRGARGLLARMRRLRPFLADVGVRPRMGRRFRGAP